MRFQKRRAHRLQPSVSPPSAAGQPRFCTAALESTTRLLSASVPQALGPGGDIASDDEAALPPRPLDQHPRAPTKALRDGRDVPVVDLRDAKPCSGAFVGIRTLQPVERSVQKRCNTGARFAKRPSQQRIVPPPPAITRGGEPARLAGAQAESRDLLRPEPLSERPKVRYAVSKPTQHSERLADRSGT